MNLHRVNESVQPKPPRHRLGRGSSSGWGTQAGRGQRGATQRAGNRTKLFREGGQMPLARRIPKRGFNNRQFARVFSFVNLSQLAELEDGAVVTPEECLRRGLIPKMRSGLKVLGVGSLTRKLTVKAHRISATARKAIEACGGTVELLPAEGDLAPKKWAARRGQGKSALRKKKAAAQRKAK